ncbi:MAG: hypothetical protein N2Z21_06865 [Candidatus Sumerlaeaceae bacterium]|nr:hypothetical protein [Candidatus Sumerlaeaceae bacterium]
MKPEGKRWLGFGVGVLVFYLALTALRQHVMSTAPSPPKEESQDSEEIYDEDYARRRSTTLVSQTRFTENSEGRVARPTKIVRLVEGEQGEGFEAEKYRAFGDSSIFGVVRGASRRPLERATVQLFEADPNSKNPPLREALTDTSGTYSLDKINDAERLYVLVARAEGHAPYARLLLFKDAPLEENITLSPGVECSGVVVDAVTSLPLPRAIVYHPTPQRISFRCLGTVETSPMGEFRFAHVSRGEVRLRVECPGYKTTVAVVDTPTTRAVIALVPGGASIRGETISRLTEKPVGRAKVLAIGNDFFATAFSDDEGRFEFTDLPSGRYVLIGIRGMPGPSEEITLADRETREGVRLIVPAPIFVTGKVIHALNGNPLAGIRLYYPGPRGKSVVMSDQNGLFAFETLAFDSYWIEVHEKGYLPLLEKRTTGSVERIERKIKRSDASDQVTIRLRPVPCIEGIVKTAERNGRTGGSVRGVDVQLAYQQRDVSEKVITKTNALGEFFVNLPSGRRGTAKIVVPLRGSLGFASARIPTRRPIEVQLDRQRMSGRLFLSDGTPLAGVEIKSRYLFPDNVDPSKAIRLEGCTAIVRADGRFGLSVAPHEKVELAFLLPDGGTVIKTFDSDTLQKVSYTFVYDPVAKDVLFQADRQRR